MPIGPMIRGALGPFERTAAEWYRSAFVNLDRFVGDIAENVPASRILEIGCGEGAVCERLTAAYPQAEIVGIDITPRLGRLFRGDARRVKFQKQTIQELAADQPGSFDLVIIADVLHHVPWELHAEFLRAAVIALRPGGWLVVKDWERRRNVAHWMCHFSDRVITGDRVRYGTPDYFEPLIAAAAGPGAVKRVTRCPPWKNNISYFAQVG